MTAAEQLRALVKEATGACASCGHIHRYGNECGARVCRDGCCHCPCYDHPAQKSLAALAPQLAELAADMGAWLGENSMRHHEYAEAWLARLDALFSEEAVT